MTKPVTNRAINMLTILSVIFVLFMSRFYWLVNLNSTVVFLGIAYIQQSVAKNLGFLIPFTSVLLALIAIHMMRNKLTYKPKKGNIHTT